MTFFFCGIRQIGCFCFVLAAKGQRSEIDKIFCLKYARLKNEGKRQILSKTRSARIFRFTSLGYLCQSNKEQSSKDASDNEEWEREMNWRIK
jgi:hypothetical protein